MWPEEATDAHRVSGAEQGEMGQKAGQAKCGRAAVLTCTGFAESGSVCHEVGRVLLIFAQVMRRVNGW